ncbi:DNA translocase FtsK [Planomicrobium sp. YIM 101495]|uniref:FtsK/SpoIIIE family DNA translocase n=1 Tax=Planomicrobium sp. YIM 101495 TaxID=2665160 RepID=UPI0012B84A3A|nr:DNA translocase FtsK [Planomicrobium sp. YIM 101495]MTD30227.1 cell division protein FtsK [Planomicrobium sp. YIM 101495]
MAQSRPKGKNKTKAKAKAKPRTKKKQKSQVLWYEVAGLVLIVASVLMLFQLGLVGRILANAAEMLLGYMAIVLPFALFALALYLMVKRKRPSIRFKVAISALLIGTGILLVCHLIWAMGTILPITSSNVMRETLGATRFTGTLVTAYTATGGGIIGAFLYSIFHLLFDTAGTWIVAILLLSIGGIILSGKAAAPYIAEKIPALRPVLEKLVGKMKPAKRKPRERRAKLKANGEVQLTFDNDPVLVESDLTYEDHEEPIISAFTENVRPAVKPEVEREMEPEPPQEGPAGMDEPEDDLDPSPILLTPAEEQENEEYQLPPIELLAAPPHSDQSGEYTGIQQNVKKLEKTFQSFGVRAKVTQVHLGPAVTKYEVLPDTGVKVSKIVSLHDDLALALAARDIRIEAPIPGKSAIGIEVPNSEVAIVSLREVLESEENAKPDSKLLFGLGRDVTGKAVMTELNKMPHLLVAGSTGSGKSVCINGIITSIIMRAKPHEVKMMMIDPKMVELNVYNGIPHLLAPVVTDPRKAAQALKKVVSEMERRYELFSHTGTRNIQGYNDYVQTFNDENEEKHPKLPFIVVIVDELADLMMVASNEVEDSITRLAQMARAAGIHLIIATQRPSVNVITGVIKANIPSRIAFAVSSSVDSRTILDGGGAEKLLGRGDMLFLGAGQSKPVRVQGAFLSDEEVEKVVDFCIEQQKAQYQEDMIPTEVEQVAPHEETDELYDEAVQLVTEMQTASVSMIQRRFRVGYSRAARIIDQMELRGVVGPYEGSKPRTVLVQKQEEY